MAQTPEAAATADTPAVQVTNEQAAKCVKRTVLVADGKNADGSPAWKEQTQAIKAEEVMAFAVRGDEITVVTTSGEKLTGAFKAK